MISAIALDLGSTSIKAGLLQEDGSLTGIVSLAVPAVSSNQGRYESDALAYAETADQALARCLSLTTELPALGLCSQRSSFLIWEKVSGQPITPLISWQDNRGARSCVALQSHEALITTLTGLRLTPYYFAPKLRVVLQENPQWSARLISGELLVGTLDTFLIWRWTNGQQFVSDASMAARTLLMDIRTQKWSPKLCDLFDIPLEILPEIKSSSALNIRLNNGLTLQASLGDQSSALLASVSDAQDVALVNLGTGGFVIRFVADHDLYPIGYLHTLVYQDQALRTHMAIEGTLNSIASALAPYPVADCKIESMAAHKDIYCLAEPSGLGAPYFRNDLRLQFSQSVDHLEQAEIACLLLEGIIFRVARILEEFHQAAAIKRIYLSGGLSELSCLQQGLALCVPCELFKLPQKEASIQGAAMLAAGGRLVSQDDAEKIQITYNNTGLVQKYVRWKQWLDALLLA
jgi:glycerol kinase